MEFRYLLEQDPNGIRVKNFFNFNGTYATPYDYSQATPYSNPEEITSVQVCLTEQCGTTTPTEYCTTIAGCDSDPITVTASACSVNGDGTVNFNVTFADNPNGVSTVDFTSDQVSLQWTKTNPASAAETGAEVIDMSGAVTGSFSHAATNVAVNTIVKYELTFSMCGNTYTLEALFFITASCSGSELTANCNFITGQPSGYQLTLKESENFVGGAGWYRDNEDLVLVSPTMSVFSALPLTTGGFSSSKIYSVKFTLSFASSPNLTSTIYFFYDHNDTIKADIIEEYEERKKCGTLTCKDMECLMNYTFLTNSQFIEDSTLICTLYKCVQNCSGNDCEC